ncbi:carboxymuconolactone decarboxylase family protein [Sphingobium sp. WW5]|uniref:carboxymuconolactone decarboxylase family protein n=1 Tax=unclassified Sphingobium TaxID=2611147 RepID=UPI003C24FC09
MTEPTDARRSFGDLAPHLAEMTDKTLFGEVWTDPALSPRDRSLITITSLISLYCGNELPFHLQRALDNGLTRAEIIATITHLAFYAGWPPAMTASVAQEPGVLSLSAVAIAGKPASIRLLEVYASDAAYQAHLKTPHFLKYKQGTADMVQSLRLIETEPVMLCAKGGGSYC